MIVRRLVRQPLSLLLVSVIVSFGLVVLQGGSEWLPGLLVTQLLLAALGVALIVFGVGAAFGVLTRTTKRRERPHPLDHGHSPTA